MSNLPKFIDIRPETKRGGLYLVDPAPVYERDIQETERLENRIENLYFHPSKKLISFEPFEEGIRDKDFFTMNLEGRDYKRESPDSFPVYRLEKFT